MYQDKQPQAIPQMAVGGNRNVKNIPFNSNGKREWSHDICDCFADCGTCIFAWCLPCMVYSQVKHRLEYLNTHGRPHPERGGSGCDGDCFMHCCLTQFLGAGWVLQMANRSSIRNRYNIDGGTCSDCLCACFCTPCELTQESRELELEENSLRA